MIENDAVGLIVERDQGCPTNRPDIPAVPLPGQLVPDGVQLGLITCILVDETGRAAGFRFRGPEEGWPDEWELRHLRRLHFIPASRDGVPIPSWNRLTTRPLPRG